MQAQLVPDSSKRNVDAAAPQAPTDLRARVLQAGSLNLFAHFFGQILRLVSNLVLARLLALSSEQLAALRGKGAIGGAP